MGEVCEEWKTVAGALEEGTVQRGWRKEASVVKYL